jgi:hypothetical protein
MIGKNKKSGLIFPLKADKSQRGSCIPPLKTCERVGETRFLQTRNTRAKARGYEPVQTFRLENVWITLVAAGFSPRVSGSQEPTETSTFILALRLLTYRARE